jgi:hypothetical protein
LFPLTPPPQPPAQPVTPVLPPTPPVSSLPVTPPVVVPEAQQIFWGRFTPLASMPADTTLVALLALGSEQVGTILPFTMTRTPQTDMVMPATGSFAFGLQASEAYVMDLTSGIASKAAISNASLSINFGTGTFLTQLNLTANGSTHQVSGYGTVSSDGKFGSAYVSQAAITGALAGKNATQAGYLFTQSLSTTTSAVGATQWGR